MKEDYFDKDLDPEETALPVIGPAEDTDHEATTPSPPEEKEAPRKRQIMGYDLSTLLIAGAALIVLMVYAVWPDSPPPQVFIPDDTVQPTPTEHPEPPAEIPTPEVTDKDPLSPADMADTVLPSTTEKVTDEIRQYGVDNREAITALSSRVADVERRLALLEEQLRAKQQHTAATVTAPRTPAAKSATTIQRAKRPGQSASATRSAGSVKGWRIHTLYPGMAWIAHNGSTWSVRPGDVLQGLTIRSIDTERRAVVTDKGTIRQED